MTGQKLKELNPPNVARDVAFSPDGALVLSVHGYHGGRVARNWFGTYRQSFVDAPVCIVWDVSTGSERLRVPKE